MGTALVTGASSGLGAEFARQLASRGHDVVLVARDQSRLEGLASELAAEHGVQAEPLPADLSDRAELDLVAARVADRERPVDLLVNSAGFGMRASLLEASAEHQDQALEVMLRAVLVLSKAAAGAMSERGHGAILNVSSVAGAATMGLYSAIKSWVTVFSEGLASEMHSSGVSVTALCPGFVHTEFHSRARISKSAIPAAVWLDADRVVTQALADVAAGRVLSVPSLRYRLAMSALRHLPRPVVRRASAAVQHNGHSRRSSTGG